MPPKNRNKVEVTVEPPAGPGAPDPVEDLDIQTAKNKIAQLEEQIRLLRIENSKLRQHADNRSPKVAGTSLATARKGLVTDSATKQRDNNKKGCSCNGFCVNKKCGCVKKNLACDEFCKCLEGCINKLNDENDGDKENKELNQNNIRETQQQDENNPETLRKTMSGRKNKKKEINKELKENKGKKTKSSSESKMEKRNNSNKIKPANNTDNVNRANDSEKIVNTVKKNQATSKKLKEEKEVQSMFDTPETPALINEGESSNSMDAGIPEFEQVANPMQPRRQLLRSPLSRSSRGEIANNTNASIHDNNGFISVLKIEGEEDDGEEATPPPEIFQAQVDWNEHQASLVVCQICSRKFYRHRIKKHESSCKKI